MATLLQTAKTFLLSLLLPLIALITPTNLPTVVKITDGDTVKLSTGVTIRLESINTPEVSPVECYSSEATKLASDLLLNKKVDVKLATPSLDRYGRTLAYLFVNGKLINEELIKQGAARYYYYQDGDTTYQDQLIKDENEARLAKIGLWGTCADPKLGACVVKGNLDNADHRRYLLPSDRHYSVTIVNQDSGDMWFCSEKEALAAGFLHGDQY